MKRTRRSKKGGRLFIIALLLTFAVGMGGSYFLLKGKFTFDSSFLKEAASGRSKPAYNEQKEAPRRLYEGSDPAQIEASAEVKKAASLAAAEEAIRKYMKSYGVRLLDLYMDKDGIIYIDLGDELKKNFKGDASEELRLIAGLYKSLEPAVPGLTALKILLEGHEAESIGGHIDISKPIGKEIAENI